MPSPTNVPPAPDGRQRGVISHICESAPGAARTVLHNVVHLRAEPKSGAELVSQTLMGCTVHALEVSETGSWTRIQTEDTYRGWCETRWLSETNTAAAEPLRTPLTPVCTTFAELREAPTHDAPPILRLPIGAGVHKERRVSEDWASVVLPNGTTGFLLLSALAPLPDGPDGHTTCDAAQWWGREFLGTPYLWGGSSSFGLDCSGLVQLCYRLAGNIILRRDADIQRSDTRFAPVEQADLIPGDLVFFGKPDKITHIGMHYKNNTFIHSAGGAGVLITEWGDERYSPGYVDARRLMPEKMHEPPTRFDEDNDR